MKTPIRIIAISASSGMSVILYLAYYNQYFRWRSCFNELGRCFDDNTGAVYQEQSGLAWLSMAVLMSLFALYQLWRLTTR
ncbi:MAG: hypothetical protein ACI9KK_002482 [Ascidiaceihabitans sp.]|jgi:hypothetical protein